MIQESTQKLFNLKKNEKYSQKHIQSMSKDLCSEEKLKKFKSHTSYNTSNSKIHKKMPSTIINGAKDNKIISINLNILPREKKNSHANEKLTDIKPTSSKKFFNNAFSPNSTINSQILKNKTNWVKSKSNNEMNELNKINFPTNNNNTTSKKSCMNKILNDQSIQELETEENEIVNDKNINNKNKTNNINNINVNINYNKTPKKKNNIKINESSFSINNENITNNLNINNINNNNLNRELLIYSKKGYKEKVLEIISQENLDINYQNENGWTALHCACDEGNLKIVEILIKAHSNVNIKNNDKKTPLHISVTRGYFNITKLLIENGGDLLEIDNEKNNLIHLCSMYGHNELLNYCKVLFKKIIFQFRLGIYNIFLLQLLNKNSGLVYSKNLFGNIPLHLAKKKKPRI